VNRTGRASAGPGTGVTAAGGPATGLRVGVVGAGLAGLAAGLDLTRAGCRVTLLERSRLLGGKATSFHLGDLEMDSGQHVVLGCCSSFLAFAEELGMRGDLRLQSRFEVLMLADRGPVRLRALPLPSPLHLALPFLTFRALRFGERMGVARALLAARRRDPAAEQSETFAAWLERRGQGPAVRRAFWEPFLVPALNAQLDEVSAAAGLFVVRTAFLGDRGAARIGYATVPLARFAEAAAARLDEVRLRTAVTHLTADGGRLRSLGAGPEEVAVDAAVMAIPPERLARIGGASALGLGDLSGFATTPIADVHLWYEPEPGTGGERGAALPWPGFDFAALAGSPIQWVFVKGPGYLCCSLSDARGWVGEPEERLVALGDSELRARVPALAGRKLVRGVAVRDPEATFVQTPGLRRPGPGTALANVCVAGSWTDTGWPATMESAVRSGRAAAAELLGKLTSGPATPAGSAAVAPTAEATARA